MESWITADVKFVTKRNYTEWKEKKKAWEHSKAKRDFW